MTILSNAERVKELETGIRHLQNSNEDLERRIKLLRDLRLKVASAHQDNLERKDEENARLREALQFYARKETYEYQHQYYGDGNVETLEEPIVDDKGEKARIALEETK